MVYEPRSWETNFYNRIKWHAMQVFLVLVTLFGMYKVLKVEAPFSEAQSRPPIQASSIPGPPCVLAEQPPKEKPKPRNPNLRHLRKVHRRGS